MAEEKKNNEIEIDKSKIDEEGAQDYQLSTEVQG